MNLREPAGCEREGGKFAELFYRARRNGGAVGNTRGTVCGASCRGAIRLQSFHVFLRVCTVNRLCSLNFEIYSVVN